jgi:predicted 2-oxoglutarate/Fe(II)-dependent dioxygenase YbiX
LEYQLDEIYPDCLSLVRWLPGDYQEPHADAENPDGELHPFSWRKYAALVYLNRDFEGGDLYFPNKKIRVRPQPKSLVMFPGTMEYLHEVEKITGGTRYTLASFWTDDPTKSAYPKIFVKGQ